jgi:hypothetical protein
MSDDFVDRRSELREALQGVVNRVNRIKLELQHLRDKLRRKEEWIRTYSVTDPNDRSTQSEEARRNEPDPRDSYAYITERIPLAESELAPILTEQDSALEAYNEAVNEARAHRMSERGRPPPPTRVCRIIAGSISCSDEGSQPADPLSSNDSSDQGREATSLIIRPEAEVGEDGVPESLRRANSVETPPSPTPTASSGSTSGTAGQPCSTGAGTGGGRSGRIGDHPRITARSNRASDNVTAPPSNAKILIFGDSQTGNSSGMGASIKTELVRVGYRAANIHVSMNCGKTTAWLLNRLNSNELNVRSPVHRCGHYWDGPSSSINFSEEYGFAFIISGGNDSNSPGQWAQHLRSARRLVSKFQNKLVWVGLAPSTGRYIDGDRKSIPETYRTRDGQWSGSMSNPDPSGAERREVYNVLLKETLNPLQGVRYIDLRDVAEQLTGVKNQLSTSSGHRFNTRWPDMRDGLHIHSGTRASAPRIGFWVASQIGRPGAAVTPPDANYSDASGEAVAISSEPQEEQLYSSVEQGGTG